LRKPECTRTVIDQMKMKTTNRKWYTRKNI